MILDDLPKELKEEWHEIVTVFGKHFEKHKNFSPLAAKLFASLALVGKSGLSFEDLVTSLNSSKSSISTTLKQLQDDEYISAFNKEGVRKRYFRLDKTKIIKDVDLKIKSIQEEIKLNQDIIRFKNKLKKRNYISENQCSIDFQEFIIKYLNATSNNLQDIKNKLLTEENN